MNSNIRSLKSIIRQASRAGDHKTARAARIELDYALLEVREGVSR